mmetsp:Transcript_29012/g.81726  ORF Transcript_29012/g.81726 Transcript_29012/m.81726 type:complete len:417 (+) Transcript_29012:165-1415(+)|eukprot:CAMPEP_0117674050 /NCGR_PEP_ID=MMETSP0804-20121206/14819_1 /TAXON_ID=1074897 /ORGANISM="Tetraselmis astigmatica, Strain CCMP880" /LENGTH=416 /DNA_ID=CAMNT_0005482869 /DNA_START=114 /DNA_END=1364 /DNA_ORIENTATION=-
MASGASGPSGDGFYCSTSGTTFSSKDAINEHYKSDYHRYNLKRRVAGLPPVTRDWFEARQVQLFHHDAAKTAAADQVLICPLTKKKFNSRKTYDAHVRSKKFRDAMKKEGIDSPPQPTVVTKSQQLREHQVVTSTGASPALGTGYVAKPAVSRVPQDHDSGMGSGEDSEWETASEDDAVADLPAGGISQDAQDPWDPCRSLFDNHMSSSMEANLEYMYKRFGFFIPEAEYLEDPEGLIAYLGLKLSSGRVPLYTRGDDPNAKQFQSLHAVQRHMVDTGRCRIAFQDNEEEYEEFYNFDTAEEANVLALQHDTMEGGASAGYELVLQGHDDEPRILGSREFAKYYRQHPKPSDSRRSVQIGTVIAQYRRLGIETASPGLDKHDIQVKKRQEHQQQKHQQITFMRENVNRNLPRNVPY